MAAAACKTHAETPALDVRTMTPPRHRRAVRGSFRERRRAPENRSQSKQRDSSRSAPFPDEGTAGILRTSDGCRPAQWAIARFNAHCKRQGRVTIAAVATRADARVASTWFKVKRRATLQASTRPDAAFATVNIINRYDRLSERHVMAASS